jgi:hypothetical protein
MMDNDTDRDGMRGELCQEQSVSDTFAPLIGWQMGPARNRINQRVIITRHYNVLRQLHRRIRRRRKKNSSVTCAIIEFSLISLLQPARNYLNLPLCKRFSSERDTLSAVLMQDRPTHDLVFKNAGIKRVFNCLCCVYPIAKPALSLSFRPTDSEKINWNCQKCPQILTISLIINPFE